MNLAACPALTRGPETGVWYRAMAPRFWQTALQTEQSQDYPSRYNEGPGARRPFEVFYLAEDHQVALREVGAMYGPPFSEGNGVLLPNPRQSWLILNVRVVLQRVADLTRVSEQTLLGTTAQELTGDWHGYRHRRPHHSVNQPVGAAPTQALGQALVAVRGLEGFRAISAQQPERMILVVFPEKMLRGSEIIFADDRGTTHRIEPRPRRRRRSP